MEEKNNLNNVIQSVKATMMIEGMNISGETEELISKYLNKEISTEQGVEFIKNKFMQY